MKSWIEHRAEEGLEVREIHRTPPNATVVRIPGEFRWVVAGPDFAAYTVDHEGTVTPVAIQSSPLDTQPVRADDTSPEA